MTTWLHRLLPYPLLASWTDDYVNATFEAIIPPAVLNNTVDINISIQYQLTSKALLNLIQEGQARYAAQVTCPSTFTREFHLPDRQDLLILHAGEYAKELTITPYVVAIADIVGFIAEEHAEEIREVTPEGFDLPVGTILALGDQTRITLDEQGSTDSVIDLVSNKQTKAGSFQIDLEGNRLEIHVNPEDKDKIETLRQQGPNSTEQAALYPALYLHAVAEALRNLPDYPDTNWAQTMRRSLELRQIDVEDEELKSNSLQYAQELMERPMKRMLTAFINRDEQEE